MKNEVAKYDNKKYDDIWPLASSSQRKRMWVKLVGCPIIDPLVVLSQWEHKSPNYRTVNHSLVAREKEKDNILSLAQTDDIGRYMPISLHLKHTSYLTI